MDTVNQKIEKARAYLADIRAGHVSFADEGAPFTTLAGFLGDLLGIIDDQCLAYPLPEGEQARVRDELLAEVPASLRLSDPQPGDFAWAVATALVRQPGDVAQAVAEWLRAARREVPAAAALAALAGWIDGQLEDETASRQYIAEQAAARVRDIAGHWPAARPASERRPGRPGPGRDRHRADRGRGAVPRRGAGGPVRAAGEQDRGAVRRHGRGEPP